ncbi:perlucin-like protein [Saccostrea echinata]|uniref:perlucin-like protein n=1 Tax=Saccostrea echinata TaxID=191078 RepID=UPI002A81C827|nr:perlucin-like protein [Saccostrea echinata]
MLMPSILVLLVTFHGFSAGFLANPGDGDEIMAEISHLRQAIQELSTQVKSSCGCASTLKPRCPDGWEMFDSSCYYFGVVPKAWQDAEVACERLGGHLATVHSSEEEQFILDYVLRERKALVDMSHGYTWLGGHDFLQEGNWMWITDEVFNYTNWRVTNPASNQAEDCMDLSGGGWNDNTCSYKLNYVCERKTF